MRLARYDGKSTEHETAGRCLRDGLRFHHATMVVAREHGVRYSDAQLIVSTSKPATDAVPVPKWAPEEVAAATLIREGGHHHGEIVRRVMSEARIGRDEAERVICMDEYRIGEILGPKQVEHRATVTPLSAALETGAQRRNPNQQTQQSGRYFGPAMRIPIPR